MKALLIMFVLFATNTLHAEDATSRIERVGGVYTVSSIRKVGDVFKIEFKAETPSGKFDTLQLESDHIHFAVKEGQKLRLSAEIDEMKGATATVSQVLLFVPVPGAPVPVWLLSRKGSRMDLRGSKYIEMHNPMSDFTIL